MAHERQLDKRNFKDGYYKGPGWCLGCHDAPIIEMCIYDPQLNEAID